MAREPRRARAARAGRAPGPATRAPRLVKATSTSARGSSRMAPRRSRGASLRRRGPRQRPRHALCSAKARPGALCRRHVTPLCLPSRGRQNMRQVKHGRGPVRCPYGRPKAWRCGCCNQYQRQQLQLDRGSPELHVVALEHAAQGALAVAHACGRPLRLPAAVRCRLPGLQSAGERGGAHGCGLRQRVVRARQSGGRRRCGVPAPVHAPVS